jgi:hypothetical protein
MANLCTLSVLYKAFTKPSKVVYIALALKTAPRFNVISV